MNTTHHPCSLLRRFGACCAVVLALGATMVSPAAADKLTAVSSGGSLVASGTGITATMTTAVTISGTWFGISQTIRCSAGTMSGTSTSSNTAGTPVTMDITSMTFSPLCSNITNGSGCTISSNLSSANPARYTFDAAVGATSGNGAFSWRPTGVNGVTLSFGGCIIGGSSCTFYGATGTTRDMALAFTSPLSATFSSAAMAGSVAGCTSATFSGSYSFKRTSDSAALYVTGT